MFNLLRNKISSFVSSIVGKAEEKPAPPAAREPEAGQKPASEPVLPQAQSEHVRVESRPAHFQPAVQSAPAHHEPVGIEHHKPAVQEREHESATKPAAAASVVEHKPVSGHNLPAAQPAIVREPEHQKPPAAAPSQGKPAERPEIQLAPKVGLLKRVASIFSPDIELTEAEVAPAISELEMALLESDVSFDAAQFLASDLRSRLAGKRVNKARAGEEIKAVVRESLLKTMRVEQFDFFNYLAAVKAKGEVGIVLFVGPNGSGKTTTIAKLAKHLQDKGISSVIAAADTFRRAAIEQAQLHGDKLGVRVVKHAYGADPTAVAFDAIAHAKANGVACVLIDTAGRQETNLNLVKEMEKMDRVLHPHLKIFVGEAIAGNALVGQVKKFNESIKLDGIILTKVDCDAKGGGALSIAFETKLPVLFIGVGQEYADLRPFDAEWVVDNVFAAG